MFPIEVLGVKSYPAKSACNLGVIFDKNFNFRSHISAICSSCIYNIRDLRGIRRHLDLDSAKLFANTVVSSRLDHCNSLLSLIAETDLTKLQRILNCLARVVTTSPPFTRSVPSLRSLHWLPVKYRVHFKICWLTNKALSEEQPVYLRSLIVTPLPSRSLRSNRGITLSVPRTRNNTGARAFSSCAPSFGTTFYYLSVQLLRLPLSKEVAKHNFSIWPSPRRHRCALLPLDVTLTILYLNINLAVTPLSLAMPGVMFLVIYCFIYKYLKCSAAAEANGKWQLFSPHARLLLSISFIFIMCHL